mmetsp:Transcript_1194/g.2407  ORF Transcript_1194/g.2407 Transcript_1194/m.2407 type:complete len:272 (-) Transcript_1194:262-1077(-)
MYSCEGSPERRCSLHRDRHSPVCISDMRSFDNFISPKPHRRQIFPRFRDRNDKYISAKRIGKSTSPSPRSTPAGRCIFEFGRERTGSDEKFEIAKTSSAHVSERLEFSGSTPYHISCGQPRNMLKSNTKHDKKRCVEELETSIEKATIDSVDLDVKNIFVGRHRTLPQSETFSCLSDLLKTKELPGQNDAIETIISSGSISKKPDLFSPDHERRENRESATPPNASKKENPDGDFWGYFDDMSSSEESDGSFCKKATRKKYSTLDIILEEK